MGMGKEMSSKSMTFAKGGSAKMSGRNTAGPQVPGQTAQLGKNGGKFATGGKTKMAGKGSAKPKMAC